MTYRAFTHIALILTPLRQAEGFYQTLFALDVAFREAEAADGWYTLPSDASWDDAEAAGISLGLCSLHRDAFTLALEDGVSSEGGRLSHVGVQVDTQETVKCGARWTEIAASANRVAFAPATRISAGPSSSSTHPAASTYSAGLTAREVEVLRLVARGLTSGEIALGLKISEKTVAHHLTHIFNKTSSENRAAAVAFAIRHGLAWARYRYFFA
jgi:DNA-binding CsgD family transcriptional regulator